MTNSTIGRIGWLWACLWAALASNGAEAIAQDSPHTTEETQPVRALRAEVVADRRLLSAIEPIQIRLTLINPTDRIIAVPLAAAVDEQPAVTLPTELIYGTEEEPALFVQYQDEDPVALRPAAPEAEDGAEETPQAVPGEFRLAPFASVGAVIDVRGMSRAFRYSGDFKIVWKPMSGKVDEASVRLRIETRKQAVIVTDYGKITFSLFYDRAPRNVENLLELARERFYDGLVFHRVIPGFLIQGGSPDGRPGSARPDGKTVPAEFSDYPVDIGTLAMARKPSDPDSASCQFFIALERLKDLDGQYTVVGVARDEESVRTLQQIANQPTDENDRPLKPIVIRFFTLIDEAPVTSAPRTELTPH